MQNPSALIIAAIAAIGLGSLALVPTAEAGGGWRHSGGGHGMSHHSGFAHQAGKLFDETDKNGDGKLSAAEVEAGLSERLAGADANADGKLTIAEFEALWLSFTRGAMVDRFQQLDDDGDGSVSGEEFRSPFVGMVRWLDRDDDGALSRREMHHRHQRQRH
ncbi:MAG TPA: hypothetical protein QGF63_10255 [Alphaproteobacteria bacterium]|jgi:hypothetical protein|nr:hypothetical protein [Alphaproteobacteria bacterium]MDP6269250.1 hypothetical protein [Alphaproteobacteria bacterium]MDP7428785.1 hypothetical protein [Alphaproteobacteria bacterium]HJM50216.1 hypothetical protein [Alphaproteobacteria bacterium]|tara:strand:+ start:34 stop:516 length:483 start_codon:yes stop_codon:yes gene_type:complete